MGVGKGILNFLKNPILGGANSVIGGTFHGVQGVISGAWTGLRGGKLKLSNVGITGKVTRALGYAAGKPLNVFVGRPAVSVVGELTKNTPADFMKWTNRFGKLGHGVRDTLLRKATKEEIESGEGVLFGYKARALTPLVLTGGALAYGIAQGAGEADYNLGLQTTVNGIMDTEGVEVTPGSINPTYTPVHPHKGKQVSSHGATGELPLALHKQRTSGYL